MSSTERLLNKAAITTAVENSLKPKTEEYWPETFTYTIDWINKNVTLAVSDKDNNPIRTEVYTFEQLGVDEASLVDYWIYQINLPGVGSGTAIRIYNDTINQLNSYNAICFSCDINSISFITNLASEPLYTRQLTAREIFVNDITIYPLYTLQEAKNMLVNLNYNCGCNVTTGTVNNPNLNNNCCCGNNTIITNCKDKTIIIK